MEKNTYAFLSREDLRILVILSLSFTKTPKTLDTLSKNFHQSIQKENNHEYPLEELMLKLKLQYLSHLMGRANSLEKTLMLGKTEGRSRRG